MILVLFTPRSGSSNFVNDLAVEKDFVNFKEPFNNFLFDKEELLKNYDRVMSDDKIVMKLGYYDWTRTSDIIEKKILYSCIERAEEVIFIGRRDFNAQLKSYYVAKETEMWGDDWKTHRRFKFDHDRFLDTYHKMLTQYTGIAEVYHNLDKYTTAKKLIFTEDIYDRSKVYRKPYTFDRFEEVNFDPVKLFEKKI